MARAATTSDVFNAIAEPQRREILALLRTGERPVTELAQALGMSQPGASKHLRVLREVGLVRVRGAGKQRLYGLAILWYGDSDSCHEFVGCRQAAVRSRVWARRWSIAWSMAWSAARSSDGAWGWLRVASRGLRTRSWTLV
jgi:DNA-binding transcriptional ArsR family regulator